MRKSISKMNSREKVLLTGVIYFLLLGIGTVGFQRIEEGAMLERCARLFFHGNIFSHLIFSEQKNKRKSLKTTWSAKASIVLIIMKKSAKT